MIGIQVYINIDSLFKFRRIFCFSSLDTGSESILEMMHGVYDGRTGESDEDDDEHQHR